MFFYVIIGTPRRGIAQLVEHWSPKPGVVGSSPASPAIQDSKGSYFYAIMKTLMDYTELERIRIAYNNKKKEMAKKSFIIVGGIFLIVLTASGSTSLLFPFLLQTIIIGSIATLIATSLGARKEAESYRNAYKNYFITSTFNSIFTDLKYDHNAAMPSTILSNTGMIRMGNRYSSNDYTIAKYNGIPFAQADVHIEVEHTDSDGDTTYETIFRGRYITFDFNKKFDKKLLVASKNFHAERCDSSFKKIELESIEFNKHFDVYAQDGFEAFYLLDPAVMERIEKLAYLYNGNVFVGFADHKIHIAINNNIDSFEPASSNAPIDEQREFSKVMDDIKVITNIVDELKLVKEK